MYIWVLVVVIVLVILGGSGLLVKSVCIWFRWFWCISVGWLIFEWLVMR